jgi:imidazolonepropionase-like amidohydrolase
VSIVEDTLSGIRSVQAAGEILQKAGLDVTVHTYGLTSGSAAKSAAFEQAGVPYFSDWETLIEACHLNCK